MDVSRDLYAAIGEVVVEATKLEHALARLVKVRWDWSDEQELAMVATGGVLRGQLLKLLKADPDWDAMHRLHRDVVSVLNDRHVLVHSLVVQIEDEDNEVHDIELWHAKSRTTAPLPTVAQVEEHAFDIGRCFVAAVKLLPEAEARLNELGSGNAPGSPS